MFSEVHLANNAGALRVEARNPLLRWVEGKGSLTELTTQPAWKFTPRTTKTVFGRLTIRTPGPMPYVKARVGIAGGYTGWIDYDEGVFEETYEDEERGEAVYVLDCGLVPLTSCSFYIAFPLEYPAFCRVSFEIASCV